MRFKGIPRHNRVILGPPRSRVVVTPGQPRKPQLDGLPVLRDRGTVAAVPYTYTVSNSLRFRASASARFNRTPGAPTNNLLWTFSTWVKRGSLGSLQTFLDGDDGASTNVIFVRFTASDTIQIQQTAGGATNLDVATTAVFRDPTEWYHVGIIYDSANATANDRIQIWVNGARQTVAYTTGPFAISTVSQINLNTRPMYLGYLQFAGAQFFDGAMAETIMVDGQSVAMTSFGQTDATTGLWIPKSYSGTFGAQGWYLAWKDASAATAAAIGKDTSGNGNNWTPTNISVTAGSTFDQLTDTPTNACATFNPLEQGASGLSAANMVVSGSVASARSTIPVPSTGKWVAEFTVTASGAGVADIGLFAPTIAGSSTSNRICYRSDGSKVVDGVVTGGYGATFTLNDVIRVEVDGAGGTVTFYKNGTSQGALTYAAASYVFHVSTAAAWTVAANFSQQAFVGTPTTGYSALTLRTLPTAAVTLSGTFTGNAGADGPWVPINGNPATLTINGNAVTFATHADKTAGGFKLKTSSASYNQAGANTWTATAGARLVGTNGVANNAQINP